MLKFEAGAYILKVCFCEVTFLIICVDPMRFGRIPDTWLVLCITWERGGWTSNLGLPFFKICHVRCYRISVLFIILYAFPFHYNYTLWRQWMLECHNSSWGVYLLSVHRYIYGLIKFNNSHTFSFITISVLVLDRPCISHNRLLHYARHVSNHLVHHYWLP